MANVNWEDWLVLDPNGVVPLYHQLKERLRIVAGKLEPNTMIPSEKQLMAITGVSRVTIRRAIADLVGEGILYARAGAGTFTVPDRVETGLNRPVGFTESVLQLGRTPSTRVLQKDVVPAPQAVARRLGLTEGEDVFLVERLRYIDGIPCMVERAHFPYPVVRGIDQEDLKGSIYQLLRTKYGLSIVDGSETVTAVNADRRLAKLLDIPLAAAVLATFRITQTSDKIPLEYTIQYARGDQCAFRVQFHDIGDGDPESRVYPFIPESEVSI